MPSNINVAPLPMPHSTDFSGTYMFILTEPNDPKRPGPGCSKLITSLINVLLKFQMLISDICQYFLLKKCEKLLHSLIFYKKTSYYSCARPAQCFPYWSLYGYTLWCRRCVPG